MNDLNYNKFAPLVGEEKDEGSSAFKTYVHDNSLTIESCLTLDMNQVRLE